MYLSKQFSNMENRPRPAPPPHPCISYRLRRSASSDRAYRSVRFAAVDIAAIDSPEFVANLSRVNSLTGISTSFAMSSAAQSSPQSSSNHVQQQQQQQQRKQDVDSATGEFIAAVQRGDVSSVLKLLGRTAGQQTRYPMSASTPKINVNTQLKNGMSALHQAAFNGNLAIMHVLLDNGSAVDLQDSRGLRPLHVASFQGHFEAVHLLLKWNSCVNSTALGALTPLHLACQAGHYDVVKLLLCNNANPMLRADDGRSAFDVACEFGRYTIVQLLMSLKSVTGLLFEDTEFYPQSPHRSAGGATSESSYRRPPSCLHLAAKNGYTDVLRLLLNQPGVNVNRVTEQGSCLHMTAFYGHVEATKLLLEQGIDPSLTNAHGRTAKEVIARDTPFARELHQILFERISAVSAVAMRDFCNLADPRSIAFRCGEHLTVLERTNADTWKGYVTREGLSRSGYFPSAAVRLIEHQQQRQEAPPVAAPPTCLPDSLAHQQHQPHHQLHHQPPPLLQPVSQSTVGPNAAVSPTSASNNRNSAASLDSGRSSAHTATSSDTRSAFAVAASGPSGPAATGGQSTAAGPASAANSATTAPAAAASSLSPPVANAGTQAHGSVDSGLGPHRQSMVSTCSSGSLGSLPDDNSSAASVSSGELQYQQQQQHGWLREDWSSLSASQQLHRFLDWCQLACYHRCIEEAGYDLATLVRCTPEDLNAAGVTNPRHRKRLRSDLARLGQAMQAGLAPSGLPDPVEDAAAAACLAADADLADFCRRLGLPDAATACLRRAGFQLARDLGQTAWEDLEEIGITRLGHQKKLMLAIDRLRRPRHRQDCDHQQQHQQHHQQPDSQQGTLRRQSAKQTATCGTCTSSDQQPDPFLAAADPQQEPPQSPPQPSGHSRSFSGAGGVIGGANSASSAAKPVAKVLGRPIPVAVPEVPPLPPPTPQRGAPPPPPKRVTSVRRCSGDAGSVTPCASPKTTPRHQAAGGGCRPPAYENAAALADSPALARLAAVAGSVSAIPFANEDCGTIRHKPASASIAAAVASPQLGRAALFQQHRQQQQLHQQLQHLPASPAFARRVAFPPTVGTSSAAPPTPNRRVLQPPPPREDPASNLDDICGMLSELQCILDKELREHQA